ncbi:hypothetical protein [Nonomuraea monospora]
MGLRQAMAVLAEQWHDIHSRLSPEAIEALSDLAGRLLREDDQEAAEEIAHEIAGLLRRRLPGDHPFSVALRERTERRAGVAEPSLPLAELRALLSHTPSPAEVEREAVARLLAAPALTAAELRALGQNPGDPALIRLQDDDGAGRWPAFQFDADGTPLPLVRLINGILEAFDDPLGAASWWLSDNGWLGDAPARLIGRVPDEQLIAAARSETAGV